MVKNPFELYPGGYTAALQNFDQAWDWAVNEYPFSSLADYVTARRSPIVDRELLGELFATPEGFKNNAHEFLLNREMRLGRDFRFAAMDS